MLHLDLSKINELQNQINHFDQNHTYSALTYYSWSFYGLDVSYQLVDDKGIILDGKVDLKINFLHNILKDKFSPTQKVIIAPITKSDDQNSFLELISNQINHLKKDECVFIDDLTTKQLEWLKTKYQFEVVHETTSNYFYETKKLIDFAGKALQKKRNHLNYFLKNYANNAQIKINDQVDYDQLTEFFTSWIKQQNQTINYQPELDFYYAILDWIKQKKLNLTVLYYQEKIIGFSVSYSINNRCEIFIEHCDETYRGAYQYLLSNSLKIHHQNNELTDRQDDLASENISFSKSSYKPLYTISRYLIKLCSN
ncbi:phosphatidylglycerol lysyltransferase domain-containing protein [Mycoplasma sp. E35C]|uniref:phosphatidylglycerol lysyltransferase domain-containing protein n=1 Tax=Mycoplasma sp. E35C TaxID=2801918 RepID=UPI001CA4511B|nr:phosphatidylglycerol lysyltransferase domain-containing protein [Mycoplasma sp. E35C]QZX49394.1 DUF2156 domain-containing protein [Mycoplasma sp. E35C]